MSQIILLSILFGVPLLFLLALYSQRARYGIRGLCLWLSLPFALLAGACHQAKEGCKIAFTKSLTIIPGTNQSGTAEEPHFVGYDLIARLLLFVPCFGVLGADYYNAVLRNVPFSHTVTPKLPFLSPDLLAAMAGLLWFSASCVAALFMLDMLNLTIASCRLFPHLKGKMQVILASCSVFLFVLTILDVAYFYGFGQALLEDVVQTHPSAALFWIPFSQLPYIIAQILGVITACDAVVAFIGIAMALCGVVSLGSGLLFCVSWLLFYLFCLPGVMLATLGGVYERSIPWKPLVPPAPEQFNGKQIQKSATVSLSSEKPEALLPGGSTVLLEDAVIQTQSISEEDAMNTNEKIAAYFYVGTEGFDILMQSDIPVIGEQLAWGQIGSMGVIDHTKDDVGAWIQQLPVQNTSLPQEDVRRLKRETKDTMEFYRLACKGMAQRYVQFHGMKHTPTVVMIACSLAYLSCIDEMVKILRDHNKDVRILPRLRLPERIVSLPKEGLTLMDNLYTSDQISAVLVSMSSSSLVKELASPPEPVLQDKMESKMLVSLLQGEKQHVENHSMVSVLDRLHEYGLFVTFSSLCEPVFPVKEPLLWRLVKKLAPNDPKRGKDRGYVDLADLESKLANVSQRLANELTYQALDSVTPQYPIIAVATIPIRYTSKKAFSRLVSFSKRVKEDNHFADFVVARGDGIFYPKLVSSPYRLQVSLLYPVVLPALLPPSALPEKQQTFPKQKLTVSAMVDRAEAGHTGGVPLNTGSGGAGLNGHATNDALLYPSDAATETVNSQFEAGKPASNKKKPASKPSSARRTRKQKETVNEQNTDM